MNTLSKGKITLLCLLISVFSHAMTPDKEKKDDKKTDTPYQKLFKDKKTETAQGSFITLHKIGQKIYVELPLKYLNEEMLLGTTISSVSEPIFITVGMKNTTPIHLKFERQDSNIVMKTINSRILYDQSNPNLDNAVQLNYRNPSIAAFKIEAYKPDSTAVIFDMTSLLGAPTPLIPIIPKNMDIYSITNSPKPELSFIKTIKAFDNNVSVKTELNYLLNVTIMGIVPVANDIPLSIDATYTLLLLPKDKMTPRIADARVGIFSSEKASFSSQKDQIIEPLYLAHRWKLVPADIEKYKKGELCDPVKPIVFYLDNAFPDTWKQPLRQGVLRWNKAFEKIGFKNALQVKDFPMDNPDFDPDNLQYSCIRYIPNATENAMGPSWTDPSTGEIINASVFVYNNVEQLLHKWRFVQTANTDPSVRGKKLPKELLDESLAYVVAHEVGHTLGLMHNMAASAAYPTDSLRSATFTKKYGTTSSIMDYARFNYVAQPQDKGVSLTPPELGVYDYYAIDWNYRYFPDSGNDIRQEAQKLEAIVDAKAKDPMYRYGREQSGTIFDPSAVAEDLGDDPIKSSNYGIKNLKNISKNLPDWITDDEDSREKDRLNLAIAQQFHLYLRNGLNMVGGMYLNNSKESSGIPRYQVLPKKKQREALIWSIEQLKNFQSFANRDMERKGFLNVSYYDQLLEYITSDVLRSRANVIVAAHIDPQAYTLGEFFDDIYAQFFKSTLAGTQPSETERLMQRYFVSNALAVINGNTSSAPAPQALAGMSDTDIFFTLTSQLGYVPQAYKQALEAYKFGNPSSNLLPGVDIKRLDNSPMYFYGTLSKLRPLLKNRLASTSSMNLKAHYQLLLFKVEKALENKK